MAHQRQAHRAGELDGHRKRLLDEAGMVWEPSEEAWERKLAALRSYRRAHGHLAPRKNAVWGGAEDELVPVGQHITNLRRPDGLGKNPARAGARAAQLAAIDEDWKLPLAPGLATPLPRPRRPRRRRRHPARHPTRHRLRRRRPSDNGSADSATTGQICPRNNSSGSPHWASPPRNALPPCRPPKASGRRQRPSNGR
ncbi:helicase associated domain-containing protein [Streptomyces sp. CA-132043]|uniref:helicase associated domain-containing protein n=1 Tax=Streptomyces sp. CA-132043 TaxID=3240048 RepID=UPI003D948C3F